MSGTRPIMIRSFLPVGQGAFYLEQFRNGKEKINVIYDCGSGTDINLVNKQIDDAFEPGETVHAVFISHLHEDHVNGLPHLLKRCRVQRLFFPLLTEESKILLILQYLSNGKGDESDFVPSFIQDPKKTLEGFADPEHPTTLYPVLPNNDEGHEQPEPDSPEGIPVEPVKSGRPVESIIGISVKEWRYIPFNFCEKNRRAILEAQLIKIFGPSCSPKDLLDEYRRDPHTTGKRLESAYRAVPGGFNANSLVLFSGCDELRIMQCAVGNRRGPYCPCKTYLPNGCLYTGDYEAAGAHKWKELEDAYKDYFDNIGCLQIPHHGARYNFNIKFLHFPNCELYIASAGYCNRYRHPHSSVIRDILAYGKHPIIVNEHPGSAFYLCVFLR